MWNTAFALGLHGDSINTSAFLWRLKAPCTEFIIERNERHYYFMLKHFSDRIDRIQLNVVGLGHGAVFWGYPFQQSRLQATGSKALPHWKLESLGTMHPTLNWYHEKKTGCNILFLPLKVKNGFTTVLPSPSITGPSSPYWAGYWWLLSSLYIYLGTCLIEFNRLTPYFMLNERGQSKVRINVFDKS